LLEKLENADIYEGIYWIFNALNSCETGQDERMNSKKQVLYFDLCEKVKGKKTISYFSKTIIIIRIRITPEKANDIHKTIESETSEV